MGLLLTAKLYIPGSKFYWVQLLESGFVYQTFNCYILHLLSKLGKPRCHIASSIKLRYLVRLAVGKTKNVVFKSKPKTSQESLSGTIPTGGLPLLFLVAKRNASDYIVHHAGPITLLLATFIKQMQSPLKPRNHLNIREEQVSERDRVWTTLLTVITSMNCCCGFVVK